MAEQLHIESRVGDRAYKPSDGRKLSKILLAYCVKQKMEIIGTPDLPNTPDATIINGVRIVWGYNIGIFHEPGTYVRADVLVKKWPKHLRPRRRLRKAR